MGHAAPSGGCAVCVCCCSLGINRVTTLRQSRPSLINIAAIIHPRFTKTRERCELRCVQDCQTERFFFKPKILTTWTMQQIYPPIIFSNVPIFDHFYTQEGELLLGQSGTMGLLPKIAAGLKTAN